MKLYKTNIVIWSDTDLRNSGLSLSDIARDAEDGESYCSKMETTKVNNPEKDPDWDGTEFFQEIE